MKRFLIFASIDGVYMGPRKTNKGHSPEIANEGLPKVDWSFPIYNEDFLYSYKSVPRIFNMDWRNFLKSLTSVHVIFKILLSYYCVVVTTFFFPIESFLYIFLLLILGTYMT